MKKLQVIAEGGAQETLFELNLFEVVRHISEIECFKIAYNPSKIITYRFKNTNFFFRDDSTLKRIKKDFESKETKINKEIVITFIKKDDTEQS